MADNHVDSNLNNKKVQPIFKIFANLFSANDVCGKKCAVLLDILKTTDLQVCNGTGTWYAAKRLVRGLAASTTERQIVIYSALTTALEKDVITVSEVLKALENESHSNNEQSFVGPTTILTYLSVLKSGKFLLLSETDQIDIVQKLIKAGARKSYLKSTVAYALINCFTIIPKQIFKAGVWPTVKVEIEDDANENPFFAVLFAAAVKYPKLCFKIVKKKYGTIDAMITDILIRAPHLSETIQDSIITEISKIVSTSPKTILLAWDSLFKKDYKANFKWISFVLKVGRMLLETLSDPSMVDNILLREFIEAILQVQPDFRKKSENLNANNVRTILQLTAEQLSKDSVDDNLRVKIIKKLLFNSGDLQFDTRTKTKTVQSIITTLSDMGVNKLIEYFSNIIQKSCAKEAGGEWTSKEKQILLSMLQRLVSHHSLTKQPQMVIENIKFIFNLGFLKIDFQTNVEIRKTAKDLFYKLIELRNFKIEDATQLLSTITKYVDEHINEVQLDDSTLEHWQLVVSANNKMSKKSIGREFLAVRLLLLHMGLTLLRDPELASSAIQELLQCYSRLKEDKRTEILKNDKEENEEPQWVEVTVDLLLAMLSRENKVLRHIVSAVFAGIAPHITPTALHQIIDALDPTSRNDVLKHIDSDDSDEEMDGSNDDEDEASGEESAIEDEAEPETVNDKLRMAVRNALGYSAALTDDESVDMDDMNEEEENRLNESLSNAFRLFRSNKNSKKKQSRDEEALTHFRVRILDLVEIIISNNPSLASCLDLIPPLFALVIFAIKDQHQKPLQNRLETVLKKLGNVKKFTDGSSVDNKDLVAAFDDLFKKEVSGLIYVEMAPIITECCGLFIRASQQLASTDGGLKIEDSFISLMDRHFLENDRKVPYTAFKLALRHLWGGNWILVKHIMHLLTESDMKIFKKQKLVELLDVFYKNDRLHSTATDDQKALACKIEFKFAKKLAELLKEYNAKRKDVKVLLTFYSKLLSVLNMAIICRKKYRENYGKPPQWNTVVTELLNCEDLLIHQKTKVRLASLAQLCDVPFPSFVASSARKSLDVKNSSLAAAVEEEDDSSKEVNKTLGKRIRRNGNSNEAMKRKKEARDLREAMSSQGLEALSFSLLSNGVPNHIDDDQPSPPKKKKK